MIVSDARREANRRNARQSTGPVTEEGKAAARRNAVKHGLTARLVADPDLDVAADGPPGSSGRAVGFARSLRPQNEWQAWLVEAIALVATRLDRAARLEQQVRAEASWRASTLWAEDRRRDAEHLGARLRRDPNRVVAELRRTPEGIDWLIERWAMLAAATDPHRHWTPEQAELAYDLLGTPADLRQGRPDHQIDADGRPASTPQPAEQMARARVADLEALRARVVEADEIARGLVEAGQADFDHLGLGRLRRYERELQARLRWLVEQFHAATPGAAAVFAPTLARTDPPEPIPPLAPAPAPARNEAIPAAPPAETKPLATVAPPPGPDPSPVQAATTPPAPVVPSPPAAPRSDPARRRPDPKKRLARSRG